MANYFYKLKKHVRYRLKTRHRKGHGIHSPYLYRFISSVIQGKYPYYCFDPIENLRKKFSSDPNTRYHELTNLHRNKNMAKNGQIIFRIVQDSAFESMLEIGTLSGFETQYMALAKPGVPCYSITKSRDLADLAIKGYEAQGLDGIKLKLLDAEEDYVDYIQTFESLDFVLFNQLSDSEEVYRIAIQCLAKKKTSSIFIFTNIHKNPEMNLLWKKIRMHQEVQTTMDTYQLGIVLFNPELGKKNYILRTK